MNRRNFLAGLLGLAAAPAVAAPSAKADLLAGSAIGAWDAAVSSEQIIADIRAFRSQMLRASGFEATRIFIPDHAWEALQTPLPDDFGYEAAQLWLDEREG